MTKDEALTMALMAMENELACGRTNDADDDAAAGQMYDAITAIKEALAQPEQEPVAWAYVNSDDECEQIEYCTESPLPEFVPLYASPPKREWVGLTDDEIKAIVGPWGNTEIKGYTRTLFDQIEAALKEKNT